MKVDLAGLVLRAAAIVQASNSPDADYYAYGLRELVEHVNGVRSGEYTKEEFCEHYFVQRREQPNG